MPVPTPAPAPQVVSHALTDSTARERAAQSAPPPSRDIRVAAVTPMAANDPGSAVTSRETRIVSGSAAPQAGGSNTATPSRVRGIGSRFKSAPLRSTEKMR